MFKWLMVLLLLLFVYHVREVFPPFIVGTIIAYLLYPLVKFLNQRCGFPPFWSVLFIYLATIVVVGALAWHFWPVLVDEATNLFEQRREMVTNLVDQVRQQFNLQIDVHETSDIILSQLQNSVGKPEEIVHFGGVVSKSLLSILVCAVTSVYMLADNKRVGRFFMRFVASEKRATVVSLAGQMDVMFRKYVLGQIGLITLMSFIAFCILTCCGIKYALLIALITGFLEIIPVLGPLLAIIIASVFAVSQLGISHFWIVPLWYWIARLLEDYVIVPNTIGHAVELHPLAVIFAVIVGETMAGALGMLIAIPVAASIKVVIDFCYPPTSPPVPHEHKSPLDKLFKSFIQTPNPHDPEVQNLRSDIDIINAMHESAQGIAPHISGAERSADAAPHTVSGSTNPIVAPLPEKQLPSSQSETAARAAEENPTKEQGAVKQTSSRESEAGAPVKAPPPVRQETLTGMAARVKSAEKKTEWEEKQSNSQSTNRNDNLTEIARQAALKAIEKGEAAKTETNKSESTPAKPTESSTTKSTESSIAKSTESSTAKSAEPTTGKSAESTNYQKAEAAKSKSTKPPTKAETPAQSNEAALSTTTAEAEVKTAPTNSKQEISDSKKEQSKDSKKND